MRVSLFFIIAYTGTYTIPNDWKISSTEVFGHTLNLNTGTLDSTAAGTEHSYKYITIPAKPALERTELWALDPSKYSTSFSGQTVTLSQSVRNFEFVEFVFKSNTSKTNTIAFMSTIDQLLNSYTSTESSAFRLCISCRANSGTSSYCRGIYYKSDTSIEFGASLGLSGSSSSNSTNIPIFIYGLN